jgi:NitT/TauT family transport system substrate-binding protein
MIRPVRALPAAILGMAALVVSLALATGLAACGPGQTTTVSAPTTGDTATTAGPSTSAGSTSTAPESTTAQAATTTSGPAKLAKLTLVAPPGPMAIPLAYMAVNNKLAGVADKVDVVVWENADQLKAYVAGGQGDFVTMPSNSAAIFYNKGLKLKLLDVSVWNITYLITSDEAVGSLADIKGETIAVPFEGSVADLMFQYIAKAAGLDPLKAFKVRYAADPIQAAQLLLSGQVENAVLSEAQATAVLLQTKDTAKPLHRSLAFDKAWSDSAGADSPIAGTVATASVLDRPDVIAVFQREYAAAVQWMVAHPDEAGQLVETQLPQLGLKAPVMTASLKNITWRYTPAPDARAALELFYQDLSQLSPEVIGGKLPDDGFYFTP